MKTGKNNNNTFIQSQQPKIDNVKNKNNNRTLDPGLSNGGQRFLLNHILHQKQDPLFIITESLNQNPNIKAQTSDEIQQLESYENSIVVFDDTLQSKRENNIDLFLTRGRPNNIDIDFISQNCFSTLKSNIRNNSNINFFI